MATIKAIADGNWNNTAIWNGGTVPGLDDIVYLNGHTVTANVGIDIANGTIRNDANDSIEAILGGRLVFSNARTFIANFICDSNAILSYTTNANAYNINITGNITCRNTTSFLITTHYNGVSITGNIELHAASLVNATGNGLYGITINGNITAVGSCYIVSGATATYRNSDKVTINGTIIDDGFLTILKSAAKTVELSSTSAYKVCESSITTLSINGTFNHGNSNAATVINTLNITGTFNQGNAYICEYINTLNLDGTINLSGIKPFTYGINITNIATGSRIIYYIHNYSVWGDIVAADADFDFECLNQNLDQFLYVNKSLLDATYPSIGNVKSGVVYGYNSEYTGVLADVASQVASALTAYGAAKASDLSGLSTLKLADIATALANYGAAKGSQLNGLSTLTSNDIAAALATYAVAKTSDVSGLSTLKLADIATALANYGTCKTSDLSSISISTEDILTALTAYGTAKDSDIYAIAQLLQAVKNSQVSREFLIHLLGE